MKSKLVALAAAGLVSAALGLGGAEAASLMTGLGDAPAVSGAQNQNIVLAIHKHHWRRHSGVSIGLGFPFLFGGYGYRPYYDDYYYGGGYGGYYPYGGYVVPSGGSHVRYCLNRYRTYNPRTNLFVGYDGEFHRCRSPYRY